MNYIKQLETKVQAYQAERVAIVDSLTELVVYLSSSKFACGDTLDGYVQINDVIRRVVDAKCAGSDAWLDVAVPIVRRS